MPDRVKPSVVIFGIRELWRSAVSVRVPGCQKLQIYYRLDTASYVRPMPLDIANAIIQ